MDLTALITAFAAKASVSDLLSVGIVGVLVYLLKGEREARSKDAQVIADALDRNTALLDRVTAALMERGART